MTTESLSLKALWPHFEDWSSARLALGPVAAGLGASGFALMPDDSLVELSFFRLEDTHATGTYPVPNLSKNQVTLYLVNQSSEKATVAGEVTWTGGDYSLPTFELEAGTGTTLDLNALAAKNEKDILGMTLPVSFENGVLKWITLSGGGDLLGRVEVTPAEGSDRFGVNCWGCCWSFPSGSIIPGDITLNYANQTKSFTTAVYYDTCSGTDGPYVPGDPNLDYSPPYVWTGSTVRATSEAEEILSFSDYETEIRVNCTQINRYITAGREVDACEIALRGTTCTGGKCDPAKKCTEQVGVSCSRCNQCCNKIKRYNQCKKRAAHLIQSEYNACVGHCLTELC